MRQVKIVSVMVCVVISATVFGMVGVSNTIAEEFYDHFDGAAIDESKWIVSTGPPRFHQYGGPFDPWGYWETPSGNPPYGVVSVNNSWVSLWNGYSTAFPYVVSRINPFPETGDFVLEFRMKYDSSNPHGTGFVVRYADSDNPLTNSIFSVWQDSSSTFYLTVGLLGSIPWRGDLYWQGDLSDTSEHIYVLKYIDGEYTVLIDGVEIMAPIVNSTRPNQIWFGNPAWAWWGSYYWTTLSVDYIRVEAIVANVTIDIKPGSFPNSINLKSKGNVPVAILSSPTFDATTVNRSTVVFADASPLPIGQTPEDVNGDGLLDIVLHFSTQNLNLQLGDTEARLTGKTLGEQEFEGFDSVRIVK